MNQKTILGLTVIVALTLISIAGLYFFSPKHAVEKAIQTRTADRSGPAVETSNVAALEVSTSTEIAAAEVDGIDIDQLTAVSKKLSSAGHEPKLLSFELDKNLKATDTLEYMMAYDDLPEFEQKNIDTYQHYILDKIAKDRG